MGYGFRHPREPIIDRSFCKIEDYKVIDVKIVRHTRNDNLETYPKLAIVVSISCGIGHHPVTACLTYRKELGMVSLLEVHGSIEQSYDDECEIILAKYGKNSTTELIEDILFKHTHHVMKFFGPEVRPYIRRHIDLKEEGEGVILGAWAHKLLELTNII